MEKEIYIENNKKFKMAERYQTFLSDFSKKKKEPEIDNNFQFFIYIFTTNFSNLELI